ncbi:hypothetical protein, partial [Pseudomonas viridiflava]|uniref:hypothetical protein n=2 Tax=Pseudomonas viridiflava TaxID=33069 RepID=UPI002A699A8B
HGKAVQIVDASVDTASGIVGGVGSYAGMMAISPVCVGVLTCALPAGLGALGTQQLVGAWDSASQITSDFKSDQPDRVAASFKLETFPGESSITKDVAASAGQSVLEMSVFGLAGKYFSGLSSADTVAFPRGGESAVGPKATGGTAGKVDDLASTGTPVRPTPQKSEIDVGADLGAGARPQVSYKNGQEVPYGTSGSVRPDWCVGNVCSVEVKNYNIAKNQSGLISNVSKQAIQRAESLPQGMQQQVVIDVRGQMITVEQERNIIKGIVQKSNGAIKPEAIEFKRN